MFYIIHFVEFMALSLPLALGFLIPLGGIFYYSNLLVQLA